MGDLLGFTSLGLVFLFTLLLALRFQEIFNVLFIALIVRFLLIIFGHYVAPLPDSTADAISFEGRARHLGQQGFLYVMSSYEGADPRFISWVIAIPYSLFGRSILMAQSISLLFGIGSVFIGWRLASNLWNNNIGKDGVIALADMLRYNTTIREIYLSTNNIGDDGAIASQIC